VNIKTCDFTGKGYPSADCSYATTTLRVGVHTYYAVAADSVGNTTRAPLEGTLSFTITVAPDTTAPVITLIGTSSVNLIVGDSYTDAGATASDNTDGNITANIVVVNPVNTNTIGTYSVTYNVSDAAGNHAAQVIRTVNIIANPDIAASQVVTDQISALPITKDLLISDATVVANARVAYNSLTSNQKELVTNLTTLVAAEIRMAYLVTATTKVVAFEVAVVKDLAIDANLTAAESLLTETYSALAIYSPVESTVAGAAKTDLANRFNTASSQVTSATINADETSLVDSLIQGPNVDLSHITATLINPLPSHGLHGSGITWASSDAIVVSNDGQVINRPVYADGDATVTLTATIAKGLQRVCIYSNGENNEGSGGGGGSSCGSGAVGTSKSFTLTVLKLSTTQTIPVTAPDGSGDVTINSTTTEAVITNSTQSVDIVISSGTTNPTIDVSSFIGSNGTGTLPAINITSANTNNTTVAIPASTTVTSADAAWDGVIAAPTVTTVAIPATSGQTKTFSTAIQVGFTGAKLSFDKAVKILLPGQADKRAGYIRTGITFTEITTTCGENSQTWADTNLGVDGDCKINSGSDLVIWTKHFTSFATYTQTTNSTGGNTGGGGGGGGGGSITYCSDVTYSPWQACVGSQQLRTILTSTPAACSMTTPQQLATSRVCELATSTDAILDQVTSTDLIISPAASSSQTAKVMAEEKELTIKIDAKLIKRLAGRILLQTERFGQAWYLDAVTLSRYYLADGQSAYGALRKFGLGIKNSDLDKIPVASGSALPVGYVASKSAYSTSLVNRLKGRIVIQTEEHGEAWYINPTDGKRYYLANGDAAYQIMRNLSLGTSNNDIRKITVGSF
jgi:hypothetical protein